MLKFNIPTENIKTVLEKSIRIAPKKSSVPALEEVCLITHTDSNTLTIIATDLETAIVSTLQTDYSTISNNDNKYIVKDSKSLTKAFKYFKEYTTNITINEEDNTITFINGNKKSTLSLLNKEVYPEIESYIKDKQPENTYNYNTRSLLNRIKAVEYATAKDSTRPLLKGIHFNNNDIVALDGFRIALNIDNNLYINNSFTLLKTGLKHLATTFKDSKNITINEYEKVVTFENEETLIILKKIEGDYVNYSHLFNEESTYTMQTDNKQIQEGFSYLKNFNKESKPTIKFIGDTMTLNNTDISFTIDNIESYSNTIGFNCDYMLDALKQIDEDTVTINMASNVNPIIIQNEEGNNKALILPIRLK